MCIRDRYRKRQGEGVYSGVADTLHAAYKVAVYYIVERLKHHGQNHRYAHFHHQAADRLCSCLLYTSNVLEGIARARGFIKKGGEPDCERAAKIVLDEFRGGKMGRITLELPGDIKDMTDKKAERDAEKRARDKERKENYRNKKGGA